MEFSRIPVKKHNEFSILPFSLANEHQVKATRNLKTACTAIDKKIYFATLFLGMEIEHI